MKVSPALSFLKMKKSSSMTDMGRPTAAFVRYPMVLDSGLTDSCRSEVASCIVLALSTFPPTCSSTAVAPRLVVL